MKDPQAFRKDSLRLSRPFSAQRITVTGIMARLTHALPVAAVPKLTAQPNGLNVVDHLSKPVTYYTSRMLLDVS